MGLRARGVSLPELLVVIAILGLGVMVSVPMISSRLHEAQLRTAASQYATVLRAARMIAVSRQASVTVTVVVEPGNRYEYEDSAGRTRSIDLPPGVRFKSGSTPAIVFRPNGSLAAAAVTKLEASRGNGTVERWIVDTPRSGIPRVRRDSS